MSIISLLKEKVTSPKRIIFPEAMEETIIQAAYMAYKEGFCFPVFVASQVEFEAKLKKLNITEKFYTLISLDDETLLENYVENFYKQNQIFSIKRLIRLAKNPLYLGQMALALGDGDGLVCGLAYTTADVVLSSSSMIGLKPSVSTPSSFFLMDIPQFKGNQGSLIALSDAGTCENPSEEELADIAIATANSVQQLLGWNPRVALLSYSTNGSSVSELTHKVTNALAIAKTKAPDLMIDGEMQLDTAIVPQIAEKKMGRDSTVAGFANTLIVPDLNVGNILYKAIQRFAQADAYGPILQGFNKPVNDLSRGSSVEDVFGVILITAVTAE